MTILLGTLAAALIVLVLLADERQSLAPDSAYYLAMGAGEKVPRPFAFRWLIPFVLRQGHNRYRIAVVMTLIGQGAALAWYADDWRAVLLVGLLPALWRFSVRHPVLVDAPAMTVAVLGAAVLTRTAEPWTLPMTVILACVAGGMRETAPIWMAVYAWSPWPLIGLVGILPGFRQIRAVDPARDNLWIQRPVKTAMTARRHRWLDWHLALAPWGILLPVALLHPTPQVWTALAVGHLPWISTSDWNRIAGWAAPVLAVAALSWQSEYWPLLLLLHAYNPYRGA